MKKELIEQLFEKFEQACYSYNDVECWSGRELQTIFNYTDWRNFLKVIDKAKTACETSGAEVSYHFVDINKMIDLAKGAQHEIDEILLTRYACYLVAQNGDPGNPHGEIRARLGKIKPIACPIPSHCLVFPPH